MLRQLAALFFSLVSCCATKKTCAQNAFATRAAPVTPSGAYRVFVDKEEQFVYDSPIPAAYCSFDVKAPVTVVIKAARDIKWVDIRPLSAAVKFTFRDSTITFTVSKPQQLSIELNGSIKTPLFLFANPPEKNKPAKNDKNVQFYERGKRHFAGIIRLKDNQSVYIEDGAVVVGVIEANNARNIKVYGRGILDGTYNNRMNDSLLKTNPDDVVLNSMKGKYHRSMDFVDCKNVSVDGVILHNSTTWQIAPIHCDSVHINNVKIISDQASDDGIDIVRSKNVLIENSFFRTKDDCIAIKAHLQYPKTEAVDNILARNNVYWNALWGNAIEIGFELNAAEIKNITFRNSDIIHVEAGAAISIHNAGTGHVDNVVFDDIRIEDARQKLFDFAIFRSQYSEDGTRDPEERKRLYLNGAWDGVLMVPENEKAAHAVYRGNISNLLLKNIKIIDGPFPYSIFYGYDAAHNVKNIIIENLSVHGKKLTTVKDAKFYLEETENIVFK
jgi:hypothetical protein